MPVEQAANHACPVISPRMMDLVKNAKMELTLPLMVQQHVSLAIVVLKQTRIILNASIVLRVRSLQTLDFAKSAHSVNSHQPEVPANATHVVLDMKSTLLEPGVNHAQ